MRFQRRATPGRPLNVGPSCVGDDAVRFRIEQDDSTKRRSSGEYAYRIYDGDRLVARYWHDHRGDEHGIEFIDGHSETWPVGRMIEFIEGGGPEPLRLSERAQAYLKARQSGRPTDT